jgi:hypothetical protein
MKKKLNWGTNNVRHHLGPMLFIVSFCPAVCLWQSPHSIVPILVGWALGRLRRPVIVIDRFN